MKGKCPLTLFLVIFFSQVAFSQVQFGFKPEEVQYRLQYDVNKLASEEMEGREAGTEGERKAAAFIKSRFKEIGLQPLFEDSYLQDFEFSGEWIFGDENHLLIGDGEFSQHTDYFVLPNSASGQIYARGAYVGFGLQTDTHSDYEDLKDLENRIFFIEYFLPPDLDDGAMRLPLEVLQKKIETAQENGALAVIFVNTQGERNDPPTSLRQQLGRENLPIVFAKAEVFEYWQQMGGEDYISLSTDLYRETYTAWNVAGYLDNQAETTVVIGGHYDHLGYGGSGSRSPGANTIHFGADDNASGTAGVMESARFLSQSDYTSSNYIFIAFSAEEKGLLGSRHFTNSDAYDMSKVSYMFNLDMIGRLENRNITLYGTGTSPVWDSLIDLNAGDELLIRKSASGQGGSDHTSFYRQNIPVLFFFTGIHEDYHRPGDTPDKINYDGMYSILNFSYRMTAMLDTMDRPEFTETPVARRGTARGQGPVLGLMPDHAFEGEGLKIMAVTDNNPAQKSGMKAGDIIVRIGDTRITDVFTYMQSLGSLRANDTVKVRLIRDGEELVLDVKL
ncbi:MAG: M28 family peptidase [Bacteroidetes bacterium]|nr:MAG: M28 family peptidase [Bacteroidota bacterium]